MVSVAPADKKLQLLYKNTNREEGLEDVNAVFICSPQNMISPEAFSGCTKLKLVALLNLIQSIERWAFCHYKELESVHFPEAIECISYQIF